MASKKNTHSIPKSAKTVAWVKPNKKLSRAHTIVREKDSDPSLACGTSLPSFDGAELLFDHDEVALGHSNVSTTQRYTHIAAVDLEDAMSRRPGLSRRDEPATA